MMETIFCDNVDNEAAQSTNACGTAPEGDRRAAVRRRKGGWTLEEDEILKEYVMKNGEGEWSSVPKKCRLDKCGKSCRLRWTNYLNPNLKKTAFSEDEEKIIIDLHAKIGNKWSAIAAKLPGRTDSEVKNFWHSRANRLERDGWPIYPPEVQREAAAYHILQESYDALNPNATASFSFSSILFSSYSRNLQKSYHFAPENPMQTDFINYTNPFTQFEFSNANSGLLLPSVSPQVNLGFAATNRAGSDSHGGFNPSAVASGGPYEPFSLVHNSNSDTFWSYISGPETASSSYTSGVDNGFNVAEPPPTNSGLLDGVVAEAQHILNSNKSKNEDYSVTLEELSGKECNMAADAYAKKEDAEIMELAAILNSGDTNNEKQKDGLSSSVSLTDEVGKGAAAELLEPMNLFIDGDLDSLLNSIGSEMAVVPGWFDEEQSLEVEFGWNNKSGSVTGTIETCFNNMSTCASCGHMH